MTTASSVLRSFSPPSSCVCSWARRRDSLAEPCAKDGCSLGGEVGRDLPATHGFQQRSSGLGELRRRLALAALASRTAFRRLRHGGLRRWLADLRYRLRRRELGKPALGRDRLVLELCDLLGGHVLRQLDVVAVAGPIEVRAGDLPGDDRPASHLARWRLLDDVCQLVGDEPLAKPAPGLVLARPEEDVLADRESPGPQHRGCLDGRSVRVDADPGEVVTEALLEGRPDACRQRRPARRHGLADARGGTGRHGRRPGGDGSLPDDLLLVVLFFALVILGRRRLGLAHGPADESAEAMGEVESRRRAPRNRPDRHPQRSRRPGPPRAHRDRRRGLR